MCTLRAEGTSTTCTPHPNKPYYYGYWTLSTVVPENIARHVDIHKLITANLYYVRYHENTFRRAQYWNRNVVHCDYTTYNINDQTL